MILDDKGNQIKKDLGQGEVMKRLEKLAPQNKEEEVILAKKVGELVEHHRKQRMNYGLKHDFDNTFKENTEERAESDGYSDGRTMRKIASIPAEMAYVAEQVFGPDVWRDKVLFKKAFVEDEAGRFCLTVDPKGI